MFDIFIVGGGINGAGIARDAAGQGLSVGLCEQNDFASGTSSSSTKLVHGGLRYLEHYEFRLVRESLKEREVLLNAAPHIIWPLEFVLPHSPEQRPRWLIRLGLFLYDNLGGRKKLPGSSGVDFSRHPSGKPLKDHLRKGFVYSDCWVDDARMVILNLLDAQRHGARIYPRHKCIATERTHTHWTVTLEDSNGQRHNVQAKALINAAGPWAARLCGEALNDNRYTNNLRLIKGSHIVVPKLFDHEYCYIFQNDDNRIVFAIPYEGDFTLIGTTDVEYNEALGDIRISEEETAYLCRAVSRYFSKPVTPEDVVWSYAGVRPLYNDGTASAQKITRDYVLKLNKDGGAPSLSIFGGKLTTYRKLSQHVLEKLLPVMGHSYRMWSDSKPLPGGDIPSADFEAFVQTIAKQYPWLPEDVRRRYCRRYGTMLHTFVGQAQGLNDMGQHFGGGLYQREVDYLRQHEWAEKADDILWRRSKLGLRLDDAQQKALAAYLMTSSTAQKHG